MKDYRNIEIVEHPPSEFVKLGEEIVAKLRHEIGSRLLQVCHEQRARSELWNNNATSREGMLQFAINELHMAIAGEFIK